MRKTIIGLVLLAGLLVAADFGAAAIAEYQVSSRMRTQLGLDADPSVRVQGFPFLLQAVRGDYREIEVEADGIQVGEYSDIGVEATLRDVRAPLSDLTAGRIDGVVAGEVQGRVRVRDADIGRAIGLPELRLEPPTDEEVVDAYGQQEADDLLADVDDARAPVRLHTRTSILGSEPTEIVAIGIIELVDDRIVISASTLRLEREDIGSVTLPERVTAPLLAQLGTEIDPGGLPFAAVPTGVQVDLGAIVLLGTARDVPLDQAGVGVG